MALIVRHPFYISSPFGPRIHPVTGEESFHNGIDIPLVENTELYSPEKGIVLIVNSNDISGNYLIIQHGENLITEYVHINKSSVNKGDIVEAGELIALSGNTGRSTGPHLHFMTKIRENGEWNIKDPTTYIYSLTAKTVGWPLAFIAVIGGAVYLLTKG